MSIMHLIGRMTHTHAQRLPDRYPDSHRRLTPASHPHLTVAGGPRKANSGALRRARGPKKAKAADMTKETYGI